MSFFSKGSKNKHYQNGHNGSNHYQKKGLLGSLFNMVISNSGSSKSHRNQQYQPPQNQQNAIQSGLSCSKCSAKIPSGSKFCLECGERVNEILVCACGQKLTPSAKFCLECGKKTNA